MSHKQNTSRDIPLDHPSLGRAHRVYATLSNHCNRACPWCSTCSSPDGTTFLTLAQLESGLPEQGLFELQLEGGEPTTHADFWHFVEFARAHPRCTQMVLCTNGVALARRAEKLRAWLQRLGEPLIVKLSINHYLLAHDKGLIGLALQLKTLMADLGGARQLILNVRLRKGVAQDDAQVLAHITQAGLSDVSNVFYLQRYGFAEDQTDWDEPVLVGDDFRMINPDGHVLGPDLIARSNAMRRLP